MKTILAVLAFALVAGQSLPDQMKSFIGHIVGGPQAPSGLVVTATPNFGSNPQPGDHVSWVIDVRNPGAAPVYYWALVQTTTNLSAPQMSCPSSGGCQNINGPAFSGNTASASITQMAPGASQQITETATVQASGPFGVVVRSGPQPIDPQDPATVGVVVATLPGQTGQAISNPNPSNQTSVWVPPDGSDHVRPLSGLGSVHNGSKWLPWLELGGVVLVAAAAATTIGANNARRKWWTNHIGVQADAGEATVTPRPIPDQVAVRLERGPAGPRGPIPVERIVRYG